MNGTRKDIALACAQDDVARLNVGLHLCIQFVRTLSRRCDDLLSEHGMGRAHHRVLFLATCDIPLTVGEMGALLGISNQALSPILKRLFSKGYLSQEVDPDDRRKRQIVPTEQGIALIGKLNALQKEMFDRGFEHVGAEGMATFYRTVIAMLEPAALQTLSDYATQGEGLAARCLQDITGRVVNR